MKLIMKEKKNVQIVIQSSNVLFSNNVVNVQIINAIFA
jgi:hypothetical protein